MTQSKSPRRPNRQSADPLLALVEKSQYRRPESTPAQQRHNQPRQSRQLDLPSVHTWKEEGADHINFCAGTSPLAQLLNSSNRLPFDHSHAGRFETLDGFNFFVVSADDDDFFRKGHPGKFRKRSENGKTRSVFDAQVINLDAIYQKIVAYPELAKALIKNTLPFDFYYEKTNEERGTIQRVRPVSYDWRIRGLTYIRDALRRNVRPTFFDFMRMETRDFLDWGKLRATPRSEADAVRYQLELNLLEQVLDDRFGHMSRPAPTQAPVAEEPQATAEVPDVLETPAVTPTPSVSSPPGSTYLAYVNGAGEAAAPAVVRDPLAEPTIVRNAAPAESTEPVSSGESAAPEVKDEPFVVAPVAESPAAPAVAPESEDPVR